MAADTHDSGITGECGTSVEAATKPCEGLPPPSCGRGGLLSPSRRFGGVVTVRLRKMFVIHDRWAAGHAPRSVIFM